MDPIITCPHCKEFVIISELNCRIFRHGILKNGTQISPHLSLEEWENLVKNDLIYGCGKPFRLVMDNEWVAEICGFDT